MNENQDITKEHIESLQGELLAMRVVTASIVRYIIKDDELRTQFAAYFDQLASTVSSNLEPGIRQGYSVSLTHIATKIREGERFEKVRIEDI